MSNETKPLPKYPSRDRAAKAQSRAALRRLEKAEDLILEAAVLLNRSATQHPEWWRRVETLRARATLTVLDLESAMARSGKF